MRGVDHVVIKRGVTPVDALCLALKPASRNLGQLDHYAMIARENPFRIANSAGLFLLARIGDAIAGRNVHAAFYHALRICKEI